MHGHPLGLRADHRPLLPQCRDERAAAFLQPSAVSLANLEKISDVQQSLADVVPKALGILWEPRAQTNPSGEALSLCPHNQGLFPSQKGPQVVALLRPEQERERLTVSELENLLETWKKMVFSPAIM